MVLIWAVVIVMALFFSQRYYHFPSRENKEKTKTKVEILEDLTIEEQMHFIELLNQEDIPKEKIIYIEQKIEKIKEEQEKRRQVKEKIELEINNKENVKEAIQALQILGYNKREIDKAMEKIEDDTISVEELIKKGLVLLSR